MTLWNRYSGNVIWPTLTAYIVKQVRRPILWPFLLNPSNTTYNYSTALRHPIAESVLEDVYEKIVPSILATWKCTTLCHSRLSADTYGYYFLVALFRMRRSYVILGPDTSEIKPNGGFLIPWILIPPDPDGTLLATQSLSVHE